MFRLAILPCSQRTTPPSSRSANHAVGRVSDESGGQPSDRPCASLAWAHVAATRAPSHRRFSRRRSTLFRSPSVGSLRRDRDLAARNINFLSFTISSLVPFSFFSFFFLNDHESIVRVDGAVINLRVYASLLRPTEDRSGGNGSIR